MVILLDVLCVYRDSFAPVEHLSLDVRRELIILALEPRQMQHVYLVPMDCGVRLVHHQCVHSRAERAISVLEELKQHGKLFCFEFITYSHLNIIFLTCFLVVSF